MFLALSVGVAGAAPGNTPAGTKSVTTNIINAEGQVVGTALLTDAGPHGVKITLDIKNLPPGGHLVHIHQNPRCEPPDFKSAGPHFDGSGMGHGEHGPAGLPAGDIPNFVLTVGADGTAHTSVYAPHVSMGTEKSSVFTNGGTSIVIHAVADKVTDAAPPRIACAVIAPPQ